MDITIKSRYTARPKREYIRNARGEVFYRTGIARPRFTAQSYDVKVIRYPDVNDPARGIQDWWRPVCTKYRDKTGEIVLGELEFKSTGPG